MSPLSQLNRSLYGRASESPEIDTCLQTDNYQSYGIQYFVSRNYKMEELQTELMSSETPNYLLGWAVFTASNFDFMF